jgi:hypothetical protein
MNAVIGSCYAGPSYMAADFVGIVAATLKSNRKIKWLGDQVIPSTLGKNEAKIKWNNTMARYRRK